MPSGSGIGVFDRNADSGALTQKLGAEGCLRATDLAGCTREPRVADVTAVVVSPDGRTVYATGGRAGIVTLDRAADGSLTVRDCLTDTGGGGCRDGTNVASLGYLAISPDGEAVVAARLAVRGGLAIFRRDPVSGALSQPAAPDGCVSNDGSGLDGGQVIAGICHPHPAVGQATHVTFAGEGMLYAGDVARSSMATVKRDFFPSCSDTSVSVAHNVAAAVPLPCADRNGDPLALAIARSPASGGLGGIDAAGGRVLYSPFGGFAGSDSFTFTATGAGLTSAPATASLTVAAAPAAGGTPAARRPAADRLGGVVALGRARQAHLRARAVREGAAARRRRHAGLQGRGLPVPEPRGQPDPQRQADGVQGARAGEGRRAQGPRLPRRPAARAPRHRRRADRQGGALQAPAREDPERPAGLPPAGDQPVPDTLLILREVLHVGLTVRARTKYVRVMLRHGGRAAVATAAAIAALGSGTAAAQQPIVPLGGQQRLTEVLPQEDQTFDAFAGDVAYNSVRNEFLLVWEQNLGIAEAEIFGRRLAADGTPLAPPFQISGLSNNGAGFDGHEPAVAYDPERDRYAVVFARDDDIPGEREIFLQIVGGDGVRANLNPALPAAADQLSTVGDDTAAFKAARPDVAYRPDLDGAGAGDAWIVAWDGDDTTDEVFNVFARRVPAQTAGPLICLDLPAVRGAGLHDGRDRRRHRPERRGRPGRRGLRRGLAGHDDRHRPRGLRAAHGRHDRRRGRTDAVTANADDFTLADPSLTANTAINELLVAYRSASAENGSEGSEVNVQRLDLGLGQIGANDQQVSSAGPPGLGRPSRRRAGRRLPPGPGRYLVTWVGQRHRPSGPLRRRAGGPGHGPGRGGATRPSRRTSRSRAIGVDNDEDFVPLETATAANPATGRWLSVWSADGPPMADNHFEEFGRQVGENFDVDGDGSLVPADCNDANAGIRPGAADVFDNGVDEDCSGADLENPDRDGDGSARPADCNDANAAIRPGAAEIPNNSIDEDCANGPRRTRVARGRRAVLQGLRAASRG